jgi:hypothetical protein
MGDRIAELPTDSGELSDEEKTIIFSVFPHQASSNKAFVKEEHFQQDAPSHGEIRTLIVATVLFVIFTRDFVDTIIVRVFPAADTWYYKTAIRTVLFATLYFLLTYFSIFKK